MQALHEFLFHRNSVYHVPVLPGVFHVCTAKAASLRAPSAPVRGHAPAGSVAMAAMNLFTLEFEWSGIEAAYVADRFARTSGAVIVVSAVNIALHTILTIQARSCS